MDVSIKVGQIYEGKKPKKIGLFPTLLDDRQILYISPQKCIIGTIDHGYTPEFANWCMEKVFPHRSVSSIIDQIEYETETDKPHRYIETLRDYKIQYDSPSVRNGRNYPMIALAKFLKWAGKEVTELVPKGEWRIAND